MDRPHFRPRFLLLSPEPPEAVRDALAARLRAKDPRFVLRVRRSSLLAWIAPPAQRIWSPAMDVMFRPHPQGTLIVGRFGPNPQLMTGYAFLSILLTFFLVFSLCWSYVQSVMHEPSRCLYGSAAAALGLVGLALSSRVGTRLAHEQMLWLAEVVDGLGEVQGDEAEVLAAAHEEAIAASGDRSGGTSR